VLLVLFSLLLVWLLLLRVLLLSSRQASLPVS